MDPKWARPWFAITAMTALIEIIITVVLEAQATGRLFDTAAGRVFNVFGSSRFSPTSSSGRLVYSLP